MLHDPTRLLVIAGPCSLEGEKVCRAVAELAQRFSITSVAEGVESSEDLQVLVETGYDVAQGYLFARPMMSSDFVNLLMSRALNR